VAKGPEYSRFARAAGLCRRVSLLRRREPFASAENGASHCFCKFKVLEKLCNSLESFSDFVAELEPAAGGFAGSPAGRGFAGASSFCESFSSFESFASELSRSQPSDCEQAGAGAQCTQGGTAGAEVALVSGSTFRGAHCAQDTEIQVTLDSSRSRWRSIALRWVVPVVRSVSSARAGNGHTKVRLQTPKEARLRQRILQGQSERR
jgi:hypothetical protein